MASNIMTTMLSPQMDASHCQIKKFSLNAKYDTKCLPILSESQQAKTIEDLILDEMIWPSSYNFLKSFSSLTTLCIYFAGINQEIDQDEKDQAEQNTVNLNALFRSCPDTLKSVHIYNTIIIFNRRGRL
jgi:hypothetical protein